MSASSRKMNRRELLKLTPAVALGAFAIPRLRAPLLKAGLGLSDWPSEKLFRPEHRPPPSMIPSSLLSRSFRSRFMTLTIRV